MYARFDVFDRGYAHSAAERKLEENRSYGNREDRPMEIGSMEFRGRGFWSFGRILGVKVDVLMIKDERVFGVREDSIRRIWKTI